VARLRIRGMGRPGLTLSERAWRIRWDMLVILTAIAGIGVAMLYSAANGSLEPWAWRHATRYAAFLMLLLAVALADLRLLLRLAYPLYFAVLGLLAAVELMGIAGMGAQRWINLGIIQLQPSELMKIAVVLAVARYFHGLGGEEVGRLRHLVLPLAFVAAPVVLVLRQPDLGTAVLVAAGGAAVLVAAGVHWSALLAGAAAAMVALPVGWQLLHDYQRRRILTFLDPESDPLGAGYHIMQSKIALGSGGLFGKGFLQGTQSHLNFVPEKQTDFVFAMLAPADLWLRDRAGLPASVRPAAGDRHHHHVLSVRFRQRRHGDRAGAGGRGAAAADFLRRHGDADGDAGIRDVDEPVRQPRRPARPPR
jgi:rod shape determining protein RodA